MTLKPCTSNNGKPCKRWEKYIGYMECRPIKFDGKVSYFIDDDFIYCPWCGKKRESNMDAMAAFKQLVEYTPGWMPECIIEENKGEMFSEGDEKAPFFSEAYLYNLMGKEDARTILALLRQFAESAGLDRQEINKIM